MVQTRRSAKAAASEDSSTPSPRPAAAAEQTKVYDPAPKSMDKEFGGIPGTVGIVLAVTFFSFFFGLACNERGCPPSPVVDYLSQGWRAMQQPSFYARLWDAEAFAVYMAWYGFTVLCWMVLPGKTMDGVELRNGEKLSYKINAFATFLASTALFACFVFLRGPEPLLFVSDHWVGLVSASWIMSTAQAFYVYAASFTKDAMLAEGGNTGNPFYDWFIGRQLNPRIGSFDIKSFNELRPGLILWYLLDLCLAAKQYHELDGRLTDSMILVVLFHSIYVFDATYNEEAILTTMDITTDGFGWMLSAGDLLWVPFTYSLQTRYLALHPKDLGVLGTCGVVGVQILGYWIFRSSNGEKNDFRNGKNPKNLEYMETERGTKLLVSGWWGWSRHPNYLGDWTMAWAWCLPTGFSSPMTYFYVIYFAILLVHRARRDDHACRVKYGEDWKRYCSRVPARIIKVLY